MVTSTRSASGKTPKYVSHLPPPKGLERIILVTLLRASLTCPYRKIDHPGYVETPARQRSVRRRKSTAFNASSSPEVVESKQSTRAHTTKQANDNDSPKIPATTTRPRKSTGSKRSASKARPDSHTDHYEFGGTPGVTAMMIGFPLLMYYMWLGATFYGGKPPMPAPGQKYGDFSSNLCALVYRDAFPSLKAWAIYWVFLIFEGVCYLYMPGIYAKGKPLPHMRGKQLDYYCSGLSSFYLTIALAVGLHFSGLFPLYTLIDEFGPLMSVAIISGFLVSIVAYASALYRGVQHRMTGSPIFDFFMGAELNPRLFGWLDLKMFFEVRIPWFMLFLISLGACARQYEQFGFVSGELGFLLMAHFLYANACAKGEELIPATWDMYYEKWGFMLIFWNLAGVPLSYCHATIYLANHAPSVYKWNRFFLAGLYGTYLFAYWVWDTCGSQKNQFRAMQRGVAVQRSSFPQLPFRNVGENPRTIPVPRGAGDDLLADGWYKYARKIHYTCDMYFSICWALVCGFGSVFPWFYPVFFALMIAHRASRDIERCRERYGKAWEKYERGVPYLFIPVRCIPMILSLWCLSAGCTRKIILLR